ncbi:alpha-D-ribose 1-methylphosphonate 5-triphosphate diphosphatase [Tardiphaga sp. OK245]|uniref:alpha-D-ribose 1-methylphosphonate 5-triphosphate diphosphatase n=1 Tax=Tardiphaga sp. OK245 TaxID=1855306 RepID=UPI0008A8165A|nr:alpha-D-ribose 1-methylphosphonate 5-triphosphate diphosphatase [Tardiphaga sp. OK245]SEI15522.1 alpha-D-ribose 1-methylphosphonate 5-triphosphate diphosphatase [Tardiphaga sp. OK245]
MTGLFIDGGRTLLGQDIAETSLQIGDGVIADIGSDAPHGALGLDASDLLVLPGIVDLHGDAFERQLMPRPGVDFPVDVALIDSDRQAIANGITTVFHGTTWSWEPGLRGAENARKLLDAIETLRPKLASDTRFHLRQETFNLDAEDEIVGWLQAGRIDLLAFNDHMDIAGISKPAKRARMVERTGLSSDAFDQLVDRVLSRADEVPASIARLAKAASAAGVPTLSHDDATPTMRDDFRRLGVNIAEFPINVETAQAAADAGDFIVFGAPNVVRGGSHTGWTKASDMIAKGLCSILASDYYYPAQLLAAFRLVEDRILSLPQAWTLISSAPAKAAGLTDRGEIAGGRRADLLLVDDSIAMRPRIVAVIAQGKLVHLTDATRLQPARAMQRKAIAAA